MLVTQFYEQVSWKQAHCEYRQKYQVELCLLNALEEVKVYGNQIENWYDDEHDKEILAGM